MRFVDIPDPGRVSGRPEQTFTVFEGAGFAQRGFEVTKVELCLYAERTDERLGTYSLITSVVHTDRGSIEMVYDEGFRGESPLERAGRFLSANLGLSGVVLRSVIALNEELANRGHNI